MSDEGLRQPHPPLIVNVCRQCGQECVFVDGRWWHKPHGPYWLEAEDEQ